MTRSRTLGLAASVLFFASLAVAVPTPSRAQSQTPQVIGTLPIWSPPGSGAVQAENLNHWTLASPRSGRLYMFSEAGENTLVVAYDLGTLNRLSHTIIRGSNVMNPVSADAIDEEGGRIFIPLESRGFGVNGIGILHEESFAAGSTPKVDIAPAPNFPAYKGLNPVAGIRYEPRTKKLLLALSPQRQLDNLTLRLSRGRQPYATFLAQWNVTEGQVEQEWAEPISACNAGPIGDEVGMGDTPFLSADGTTVNLLCGTGETGWLFVSVPLDDTGKAMPSAATSVPAPSGIQEIVVDARAQRTHVFAEAAYGATFDWTTNRVIGTFAVSQRIFANNLHPGLDPETGRIYIMVPPEAGTTTQRPELGGILMVDGRLTPLPQALAFRDIVRPAAFATLTVDPGGPGRPRKFFARSGRNVNQPYGYWEVISDPVPLSGDGQTLLADRTADVDEVEGKTDRSYAGEASGYGTRGLIVGGIHYRNNSGTEPVYNVLVPSYLGACALPNRELRFGGVKRSGLASIGAFATSHALDADLGTQTDMADLSRCWPQYDRLLFYPLLVGIWPPAPEALKENSPGWGDEKAECSGDSADEGTFAENEDARATSTCKFGEEHVSADAVYPAFVGGPITVGASTNAVELKRDAKLGIVTESISSAEAVTIDGVGSIGRVSSFAKTYARGRTPKAGDPPRAVWTVEMCGVKTADYEQEGCEDPEVAVDALNQAGRGRVVFSRPSADPDLLKGTPGGYLTAIQRDKGEASIALLEHGDENLSVPGLEIQFRENVMTYGIHRLVVQLAGVRTSAVYGISVIPDELNFPPEDGPPDIAPTIAPPPDMGPTLPSASPAIIQPPKPSTAQRIVEIIRDAARVGLRIFHRALPGTLVMAGVWWTFGLPAYLTIRRRRLAQA